MADLAKKHSIICLKALLFLLNFADWLSSGKAPHRRLLLRLGVVLVYPCSVSCYNVPNARRPSAVKLSYHMGAPVHSTSFLLFTQVMWHPAGTVSVSVSVSAQDGIGALGKAHTRSAQSLSSLPKVALETVPIFAWLNTGRSRPWRVEYRSLPFSTHLSFRRSML